MSSRLRPRGTPVLETVAVVCPQIPSIGVCMHLAETPPAFVEWVGNGSSGLEVCLMCDAAVWGGSMRSRWFFLCVVGKACGVHDWDGKGRVDVNGGGSFVS